MTQVEPSGARTDDGRHERLSQDSAFGTRLGRVRLRIPDTVQYLHTSSAVQWQGAFLTHMRTGPSGSFDGCWSWLGISHALCPTGTSFLDSLRNPTGTPDVDLMVGVPGETYSGSWSAVLESVNLFVDPALVETVLHRPYSEGFVLAAVRRLHTDKTIKHLLAALLEDVVAGSPAGPLLGETIVAAILRRLHAAGPSLPGDGPGARLSSHELGVLRKYVHENLSATLHLNDLAGRLDLSVRHFCRTLRATVGMAPHQYVIHCRLEHARQLLAARAMSFDEIAEACGFADRRHMSSTFRRVLGITPLQSRNTSQQSPAAPGAAAGS